MLRSFSWLVLSIATLGAATVACSSSATADDAEGDEPSEDALEAARATTAEGLPVFTSESPSGGTSFNFCTTPAQDGSVNLTNAAWLAMLSANEYAHLGYFAPQLLDFGFGQPSDRMWVECGHDLGRVRDYELTHETEVAEIQKRGPAALLSYFRDPNRLAKFGTCGASFVQTKYTGLGPDGPELPGSSFRDSLMGQSTDASYIQFLSAKPYTFLERLMGRGSAQAAIAKHGTLPIVIVSFRGTEPPSKDEPRFRQLVDLITDVDAFKTDLTNAAFSPGWGYAHRGFVNSFQALDDVDAGRALTRRLRMLTKDDPNVGIWITGHSLGGALATLMTARLLDMKDQGIPLNVKGMVTFGSPMVGNEVFKARLEDAAKTHGVSLVRFRNDQDRVTWAPSFGHESFNYHHVGTLAFLNASGFSTPKSEPGYPAATMDDHSIAGLLGTAQARTKKSGYYVRIRDAMRANPALSKCGR